MLAAIALVLLAAAPEPPAAAAPPRGTELRAQVRQLLGVIDRPVTEAQWRALGPEAVPVLEEHATAADELPFRRARALEGLALLGGPRAEATALRVARAPGEPWDVRASAVRGLGRLLAPDRLEAALVPLMAADRQRRVRDAAAETLARHGGARGCAAVRAEVQRGPKGGAARAGLARAVARCDARTTGE